jgi:hypothetical protein
MNVDETTQTTQEFVGKFFGSLKQVWRILWLRPIEMIVLLVSLVIFSFHIWSV